MKTVLFANVQMFYNDILVKNISFPLTLFVGMQIVAATLENSVEAPQKVKK